MQTYVVLFVILSFIGCVQAQSWIGSYTAGSSCPTSFCCCVTGQVVVTTVATNTVSFTTGLSGGLFCGGSPSYTTNMTTPTTYVTALTISIITLTFTLSSDSLRINVTNSANALCGGALTKVATGASGTSSMAINMMSQSKSWLLVIMVLISLMRKA